MRATASSAIIVALLASTLILGIALRLADPLSTRALGAEDPYTHIVFTKEWLDQGYFADSFHLGTSMYPPGMHAFLGAFVPFTGVSMYEFARFAPAFFGALAILGMFVLANKLSGPVAGLGAAFLTAIVPEHIFRTELLFPTALDLALLPLWLYAYVLALEGRRSGAILFAAAGVPLAIMHPWLVPLFAAPLAIFAALRVLRTRAPVASLRLPAALLVGVTAFAMAFRWDKSDTGFSDFLSHAPGLAWLAAANLPGPLAFVFLLAVLGALAAAALGILTLLARIRAPRVMTGALAGAIGAGIVFAVIVVARRDLPHEVSYEAMLGPIAIVLGLAGLALAFLRPSALGDLGLAVSAFLFPLTALDLFGSPFWPQRTVVYLSVGVALLAGCALAQLAEVPMRVPRFASSGTARTATVVVLALLATGVVVAQPVNTYEWYRLYDDEDFSGFERVAEIVSADPEARVFIFTWQPALLVKTLAEPDHVWYSPKFFGDTGVRESALDTVDGPAYVLVDKHTRNAEDDGKADLGFLGDGSRYQRVHATPSGSLVLFKVNP